LTTPDVLRGKLSAQDETIRTLAHQSGLPHSGNRFLPAQPFFSHGLQQPPPSQEISKKLKVIP